MTQSIARHPLEELAEEYVTRYRRGERPPVSEYQARYPELADQISDLLQAMVLLEDLAPGNNAKTAGDPITSEGSVQRQLGDYTILREIGRGGMGVVYEAQQESLGRHVALKVLPLHALMDPQHLKRFQREVRAAASLHHTNIVPVYGAGEQNGLHFYAMQYIQGQGLDEVLRQMRGNAATHDKEPAHTENGDPESKPEAAPSAKSTVSILAMTKSGTTSVSKLPYFQSVARIGIQVAEALAYAHEQGIVHRDIKPSNLLLDQKQTVWVTDFGLATSEGMEELTHTGDIIGTLRYMPPERLKGWSDRRSDIYSLGLTLYELLTLHAAFDETDRARLLQQISHSTPPAPRKLDATIPRDLETIVLKATSKEPGERYLGAGDLATDLRRFVDNRPIEARRASVWVHVRAWCRRNPGMAVLSGALLATLVLGMAGILWQNAVAREQRDRAIKQAQLALENRRKAFSAGERLLKNTAYGPMQMMPGTGKEQRLLLEEALAFYQEFTVQGPHDPESRREIGVAHGRLGLMYTNLRQFDSAPAAFRQSITILKALSEQYPANPRYRLDLAITLQDQGHYLISSGTHEQAKESLLAALALLEQHKDEPQNRNTFRHTLTATLHSLGETYSAAGEFSEAEKYYLKNIAQQVAGTQDSSRGKIEQISLVKTQYAQAQMYVAAGRKTDAIAVYQKCLERLEQVAQYPDGMDNDLTYVVLSNIGRAYRDWGDLDEAEKYIRLALTESDKHVRRHPYVAGYQLNLGSIHSSLASVLRRLGKNADAEKYFEKAIIVHRTLVENHPESDEFRTELAGTLNNTGHFYLKSGRSKLAQPLLREALTHHELLLQREPDNLQFITNHAGTCINLGDISRGEGNHEAAVAVYHEAIQRLEKVVLREPKLVQSRRSLFSTYWSRAMSLTKLAREPEATKDWRRAVEVSEGQLEITMRLYRPLPLAYVSEYARADAEMQTLLSEQKILPNVLYDFACAYGLCGVAASKDQSLMPAEQLRLRKLYADRAVEMLGKVHAAGELARPGRFKQLQQGAEFAVVRDRADFQKIVNEVEAQLSKDKK